jgi:hypothetical protein
MMPSATSAAGDALDDADRRLGHGAEAVDHAMEGAELRGRRRRRGGELLDQGHVGMGDEEVGVGAAQDQYPHRLVGLDRAPERVELADQGEVEQVEWWVVDGRRRHSVADRHPQAVQVVVPHVSLLLAGPPSAVSRQLSAIGCRRRQTPPARRARELADGRLLSADAPPTFAGVSGPIRHTRPVCGAARD